MAAPHEVIAAPLTIFLADVGTAFPDIDDAESAIIAAQWTKLGTEGARNYDEEGVNVNHGETTFDFVPAGATMPTKRFRTAEDFLLKANLVDLSPAQYAMVMNDAAITTTSPGVGTAGSKKFSLYRGDQVNSFALYARGMSSVDNELNLAYKFSKAFVSVNGEVTWTKGKVAMLPVEIQAVHHSDSDLIECEIQTGVAS